MNDAKYIGLDVHHATISVAVLDSAAKLVMEAILETKAETILQFLHVLRGSLQVTWEEGTCAAWLHDLLKPHVTQVLVCDPRSDRVSSGLHNFWAVNWTLMVSRRNVTRSGFSKIVGVSDGI
jgi:hypothetical protein